MLVFFYKVQHFFGLDMFNQRLEKWKMLFSWKRQWKHVVGIIAEFDELKDELNTSFSWSMKTRISCFCILPQISAERPFLLSKFSFKNPPRCTEVE